MSERERCHRFERTPVGQWRIEINEDCRIGQVLAMLLSAVLVAIGFGGAAFWWGVIRGWLS